MSDESPFSRLHPSLQYHIVNTLGWPSLRPLQSDAIDPVLAGDHGLFLAPTAGGKTEAATFPMLTRIANEGWRPLSVIYIAPLRALLNNLLPRLEQYAGFTGHRVALWHGDVGQSARTKIIAEPPDILLTTPESLEAMLISRRLNEGWFFPNLRAVIIDEVHAFADGDRGWHLLSVLERLTRVCGHDLQRIGLSATVGNPEELLGWISGSSPADERIVNPPADTVAEPEVTLDYVGSQENAARLISQLHVGEKRLVFVDSRRGVEELASELRQLEVNVFVSHGSLGQDERRRAETAFAEASNCVIVATSTLELGIDVGDLDRVIQIGSPSTVASFLQRIGRTGRRAGASRNALFLALDEDQLLQAAGLLLLWQQGFVEDATPPPFPLHLLAQQMLALTLQEADGGLPIDTWREWFGSPPSLGSDVFARSPALLDHMLAENWLFEDGGLLAIGDQSSRKWGGRHFMELMASFTSSRMYTVLQGRQEIGSVPDETLVAVFENKDGPPALLLAGRSWKVNDVDWKRRRVQVEPTDGPGKVKFPGGGVPLSFDLCQAMQAVLAGHDPDVTLTQRAQRKLAEIRTDMPGIQVGSTTVVEDEADDSIRWWTFAGLKANLELAARLSPMRDHIGQRDNLYININQRTLPPGTDLVGMLDREGDLNELIRLAPWAVRGLKLAQVLTDDMAHEIAVRRLADEPAVDFVMNAPVRRVVIPG